MAKRPAKKPEKQLDLPSAPSPPPTIKVLPMQLRVGDRLTDETGDLEIIGRPFSTAAGKTVHARIRKANQPNATDLQTWGAHEHIRVKRASAEEGRR